MSDDSDSPTGAQHTTRRSVLGGVAGTALALAGAGAASADPDGCPVGIASLGAVECGDDKARIPVRLRDDRDGGDPTVVRVVGALGEAYPRGATDPVEFDAGERRELTVDLSWAWLGWEPGDPAAIKLQEAAGKLRTNQWRTVERVDVTDRLRRAYRETAGYRQDNSLAERVAALEQAVYGD